MFKNCYYDTYSETMHLWYSNKEGKSKYKKEKWLPYCFIENKDGKIKTISGKNVKKVIYKTYKNYSEEKRTNIFENRVFPEVQYLSEKYAKVSDDELNPPKLKIYSIDIEVLVENNPDEFPDPIRAEEVISIISVRDFLNDKKICFGLKSYKTDDKSIIYNTFNGDEKKLMKSFFRFMYKNPPDILTGWNINYNKKMIMNGFDLPYIVQRAKNIFGDDTQEYKLLSPIKKVKMWKTKDKNLCVDIVGVSILDYQALYKWYSRDKLEAYSLNFVSNHELNETKLTFEGDLTGLFHNDYQRYVDYNLQDIELPKKLDDKLNFINLTQTLSLLTRTPMKNFLTMTTLLEGKFLTYYRRNNLCAPFLKGGKQESYSAAFIKQPILGLAEWIGSIDIVSSYPIAIITLNISPETYIGRIQNFTADNVIKYTSMKKFPSFNIKGINKERTIELDKLDNFNLMLKKGLICIAPCGSVFKTKKKGVMALIEKEMFLNRRSIKKQMKNVSDEMFNLLNMQQLSLKLLLNSLYGITAVPYSRYWNVNISEAITTTAKNTIIQGQNYINELLNKPNKKLLSILKDIKNNIDK